RIPDPGLIEDRAGRTGFASVTTNPSELLGPPPADTRMDRLPNAASFETAMVAVIEVNSCRRTLLIAMSVPPGSSMIGSKKLAPASVTSSIESRTTVEGETLDNTGGTGFKPVFTAVQLVAPLTLLYMPRLVPA